MPAALLPILLVLPVALAGCTEDEVVPEEDPAEPTAAKGKDDGGSGTPVGAALFDSWTGSAERIESLLTATVCPTALEDRTTT